MDARMLNRITGKSTATSGGASGGANRFETGFATGPDARSIGRHRSWLDRITAEAPCRDGMRCDGARTEPKPRSAHGTKADDGCRLLGDDRPDRQFSCEDSRAAPC